MVEIKDSGKNALEVWGGIECTINRVKNQYFDQLEFGDFYERDDLANIIDLGVKTLRFPVLWEKHQPKKNGDIDWEWCSSQLHLLKTNGINPVVGLVHHGSGPSYTDLLKDDFAPLLAAYARQVAEQFPWITHYTPVNEPLTTARFSGLYGIWYPHKTNDVSFVKMLLNELEAVVLCMQEIRKVNPAAKLLQTEDLAKTYSTPLLSYQAKFENYRRWLTYDILCGMFDEQHPLWKYFKRLGIPESKLRFFIENKCPPDIIGVNHYLTSERYLDEDMENYPEHSHGGNTLHQYADVEAVRVSIPEPHGLELLLQETWSRYKIPIVITEVHLHCSREEQLRWFKFVYAVADRLKNNGIEIQAVTAWALLGSFGWNKLLTTQEPDYETGAFDISAGYARITAVGKFVKNIIMQQQANDHLLELPGWWQRKSRFFLKATTERLQVKTKGQPVLILGKTGTLGKAFSHICSERNINHVLVGRDEVDICTGDIEALVRIYNPWAIINATGYVKIDEAEKEPLVCNRVNAFAVRRLAQLCEQHAIKLMSFSSDMVFDGSKLKPYTESDRLNPLNIYGESKLLAESFLRSINPGALIIRTSAFFGPWDNYNFVSTTLKNIGEGKVVRVPADITISPTYVPHLVHAALDLLIDEERGIWHLANKGSYTWYEFAKKAAQLAGMNDELVEPITGLRSAASRPAYTVLASEKYSMMPDIKLGLEQYFLNRVTPAVV